MALNTFAFLKKKKRFWWGLKAEKALIETKFCFNTRREWPMKIPLGFCFCFFFSFCNVNRKCREEPLISLKYAGTPLSPPV
jgi:hypothetical protein